MNHKILFTVALVMLIGQAPLSVAAPTDSYQEDEAIDEQLGLLDMGWKLDLVNIRMRLDQPLEVRPGFPPYDEQVQEAQNFSIYVPVCVYVPRVERVVCS